jgi:large subunit ribosomal protein L22
MPSLKTNERPGTRAVLRHSRVSAYKAREVLDLIRGQSYERATEILEFCDRGVAEVIGKLLSSAAANARHNDGIDPEEMFVAACFADEGTTLPRWRPRARGRATRIRKRTCHITVILSRLPEDQLARRRARVAAEQSDRRARRVAGGLRRSRTTGAVDTGKAGAAPKKGAATEPEVASEALAALEEARALESESHHQELEAEAGAALEHEFEDAAAGDLGEETFADSADHDAATDEPAAAGESGTTAAEAMHDETDASPSGDAVSDEPEVSPASAEDDGAEAQPDEEN